VIDPAQVALMGTYYRHLVSCRDLPALDALRRAGLSKEQAVRLFNEDVQREPVRSRRLFTRLEEP
jgi:hypothetical protein